MFQLYITTDNDAFHPDARGELCKILRDAIDTVTRGELEGAKEITDTNGNTVGTLKWRYN